MVTTTAHNFMTPNYKRGTVSYDCSHPDRVYFFLQRWGPGKKYRAKFKMKYFDIYPEYVTYEQEQDDGYKGCDIAVCCVQLDD